jgi:hypothetical protein
VDLLVIAESINVASSEARRELQQANRDLCYKDQKEFRDSAEGIRIMSKIYDTVREKVLVHCELINTTLTVSEVQSICYAEPLDFVDKLLVLLCKKRSSILVTNDGDFLGKPIDIMSNNDVYAVSSVAESKIDGSPRRTVSDTTAGANSRVISFICTVTAGVT